jgi:hypothetical protein
MLQAAYIILSCRDTWLLLIFPAHKLSVFRLQTGAQLLKPRVALTVKDFEHFTFCFGSHTDAKTVPKFFYSLKI